MAKSVVCGGDTYLLKILRASSLIEVSNALPADRMAALSATSWASIRRWYCSTGYLESIGSHTGCSSLLPGRRMANSTSSSLPGMVLIFLPNCAGVSTFSMMAPSCISPQVPRDLTLVITRFRSPTLLARVCISPRPLCTCSSRSLTSLNDSPRRCSSVACNFSSTVRRISSSLVALSAWMAASRSLSAARNCSAFCWLPCTMPESCSDTPSCRAENWLRIWLPLPSSWSLSAVDMVPSWLWMSALSESSVLRVARANASKRSWIRVSNKTALSAIAWRDLTLSAASVPTVVVSSVRKPTSVSDSSLRAVPASAWPCAKWASSALLLSSSRPATAWREASSVDCMFWVKPCICCARPCMAPSFLATASCVACDSDSSARNLSCHSAGNSTRGWCQNSRKTNTQRMATSKASNTGTTHISTLIHIDLHISKSKKRAYLARRASKIHPTKRYLFDSFLRTTGMF